MHVGMVMKVNQWFVGKKERLLIMDILFYLFSLIGEEEDEIRRDTFSFIRLDSIVFLVFHRPNYATRT